ncbi:MAG TPA: glycosyltransferase family 39 protein, partial [Vicinamibacterales bacterium]
MSGRRRIAAPTRSSGPHGATSGGFREAPWFLPLAIFVLAAAVRLAVLSTLWDLPLVRTPRLDSAEYFSWALRLAAGDAAWPVIAQHGPGYPFFLAALLAIGDGSIKFALAVQALVGAASAAGLAVLARRLYSGRSGWIAGVLYAAYGPVVLVETTLLGEGILLFLTVIGLVSLTSQPLSAAMTVTSGVALGLAVLVRPTALSVVIGAVLWLAAWRRRADPGPFRQYRAVTVFSVMYLLMVAPALVKNWSMSGSPSIQ